MRRAEAQRGGPLFRRGEWFRLISMLFMLVILYMMIQRARDASVWRWLVNETNTPGPSVPEVGAGSEASVEDGGAIFDGPTDLDEEEAEAARELFTAVSDRTSLSAEEMPAYWRLWRWSRAQSVDQLRQRARRDVTLSHFLEVPDNYRGQVIRLRLHLRRSLSWEVGPEEQSGGAKVVYEAWGWSDESPNFYCIVFTQPPPGMPIGPNVLDEVTFYGYFLKLISYRDQQDKLRAAPLLIGRVERHAGPPAAPQEGPWTWAMLIGGGLILLMIVVRWTRAYAFPVGRQEKSDKKAGRASFKKWLDEYSEEAEGQESSDRDGESAPDNTQAIELPDGGQR